MFTLPDDLINFKSDLSVFYYFHVNNAENNNSKLNFSTHCLTIGINGTKKIQTADGIEEFAENDLILYRPGNYLSYTNVDNDQPYQCLMIFFTPRLMVSMLKQIFPDLSSKPDPDFRRPYFSLRNDGYPCRFLESVNQLKQTGNLTEALQQVKLIELLCYLHSTSQRAFQAVLKSGHWEPTANQLYAVMENSINNNFDLEELAFMCNMSLATFKRSFSKNFGVSPGKWLKEKRLGNAAIQIKQFNKSPKEVFADAGYVDYSSFSYAFKEMFGVSPKEYTKTD